MAHRFFVAPEKIEGDTIEITGEDVRHIVKVLRLKNGDEVIIADGTGQEYYGKLAAAKKERVTVKVERKAFAASEPPVKVTLLQGIPKGDKMELIVQKCTELGIFRIVPVAAARTIVQLSPEKARNRVERWQRVAEEAAKQSQRAIIPCVEEVRTVEAAISKFGQGLMLVPWEEERSRTMKEVLQQHGQAKDVTLLIGPEGGLEASEVELAMSQNAVPVTLGPRILRTETAGWAALTMILYELGDLGGTKVGS